METTEKLARKVLKVVDCGLVEGLGSPVPGQMCVEAAVNYAMGQPHGDRPSCVSPALRQLKIALNDKAWSSTSARAKGMRRLAIAQLGSAGVLDDVAFVQRCAKVVSSVYVPEAKRYSANADAAANAAYAAANAAADAAANAAANAAYAYAAANATYATASAFHDEVLSRFAEDVVQILIEMKAPGCEWLYLTE